MRRLIGMLLASAIALAATGARAHAAPVVSLVTRATPVPGFHHTGNIAGAGAALEATIEIHGTEYGGFPPPLIHLNLSLPTGIRWNTSGFQTCGFSEQEAYPLGSLGQLPPCVRAALSHRPSTGQLAVAFGQTVVPESVSIQPFYNPGGALTFLLSGHEPVLVEMTTIGVFTSRGQASVPNLGIDFPPVETVPGAQLVSVAKLTLILGSGLKLSGTSRFSLRMPKACPRGGLRFSVETNLGKEAQQTVSASYREPCPRGARSFTR